MIINAFSKKKTYFWDFEKYEIKYTYTYEHSKCIEILEENILYLSYKKDNFLTKKYPYTQ
jgi:hypothetical protein